MSNCDSKWPKPNERDELIRKSTREYERLTSWFTPKTYNKIQMLREASAVLAKTRKDYRSAMKLTKNALNCLKRVRNVDPYVKDSKMNSCYRELTLYALKIPDFDEGLQYAKLYGHGGYIGDIYFHKGYYEKCLDAYMSLNQSRRVFPGYVVPADKKIARNRMGKVVRAFCELNKKKPRKYSFEGLRTQYSWLLDQVVERFGGFEAAFLYYNCSRPFKGAKEKRDKQTRCQGLSEQELAEWLGNFQQLWEFDRGSTDRIDYIGNLLRGCNFDQAEDRMMSLYKTACELEQVSGAESKLSIQLVTDIADIFLIRNKIDEAISWMFQHIDAHWRMIDYYLNLKHLFDYDLSGRDIAALGHSQKLRNVVAIYSYPMFYVPSQFALRHREDIEQLCDKLLVDLKRKYGKPVLRRLPKTQGYTYQVLGGRYGQYGFQDNDLVK